MKGIPPNKLKQGEYYTVTTKNKKKSFFVFDSIDEKGYTLFHSPNESIVLYHFDPKHTMYSAFVQPKNKTRRKSRKNLPNR